MSLALCTFTCSLVSAVNFLNVSSLIPGTETVLRLAMWLIYFLQCKWWLCIPCSFIQMFPHLAPGHWLSDHLCWKLCPSPVLPIILTDTLPTPGCLLSHRLWCQHPSAFCCLGAVIPLHPLSISWVPSILFAIPPSDCCNYRLETLLDLWRSYWNFRICVDFCLEAGKLAIFSVYLRIFCWWDSVAGSLCPLSSPLNYFSSLSPLMAYRAWVILCCLLSISRKASSTSTSLSLIGFMC